MKKKIPIYKEWWAIILFIIGLAIIVNLLGEEPELPIENLEEPELTESDELYEKSLEEMSVPSLLNLCKDLCAKEGSIKSECSSLCNQLYYDTGKVGLIASINNTE